MAGASFQTTVNIQYAFGVPGALYDDSPVRATTWILASSSAAYNVIGATAFTAVTPDPGTAITAGTAQAGGTGQFVGILSNLKTEVTAGTSLGALYPSGVLPNNVEAQLVTMGHLIVQLPGPASIGDAVAYDQTTGELSTYPKTTSFTGAINASTGVLTVTGNPTGFIQPGLVLNGAGVQGVTITAYDSGVGGTGTYYTDYNAAGGNISAETMTAASLAPPASSFTASIATTGVMTVTAIGSGEIAVGDPLYGTNVPAGTVVATVPAADGTGSYTVTPAPAVAVTSTTITTDQLVAIPRAEVIIIAPAGNDGLGVISLTNA